MMTHNGKPKREPVRVTKRELEAERVGESFRLLAASEGKKGYVAQRTVGSGRWQDVTDWRGEVFVWRSKAAALDELRLASRQRLD